MNEEIDTTNNHLVGSRNGHIVITFPPQGPMGKHEALRLAAWIVALADDSPDHEVFAKVLEAVEST